MGIIDLRGKITGDRIEANTIDGDIHIKSGTIGTARMALNSVTSAVLADNSVTPTKVNEKIRTRPLAADDTETTNTLAADKTQPFALKSVRFAVKNAGGVTPDKIVVVFEAKSSLVSNTVTIEDYIDAETTSRASSTTSLTSYDLLTASFSVGVGAGQLTEGVHTLTLKVKCSDAACIASMRLTEIYQVIL